MMARLYRTRSLLLAIVLIVAGLNAARLLAQDDTSLPQVVLDTSAGEIVLELYPDRAPVTVDNFLAYVQQGFYDGTIFHRVIKRFMIQGGGYTADLEYKEGGDPIINESSNGLHNDRWSVAMARTEDPDSASSQFFINLRMNPSLDAGLGKSGYAVFGRVIAGQHVVRDISLVETVSAGGLDDVPLEPVIIHSARVLTP